LGIYKYQRLIAHLVELKGRGSYIGGPHCDLAKEAQELLDRAAPPTPDDVRNMLNRYRPILGDTKVDRLDQQVDYTSVESRCSIILTLERLCHPVGRPPANQTTHASEPNPLFDAARTHALESRIKAAEADPQKVEREEQNRVNAEQKQQEPERIEAPTLVASTVTGRNPDIDRLEKIIKSIESNTQTGEPDIEQVKKTFYNSLKSEGVKHPNERKRRWITANAGLRQRRSRNKPKGKR
jgi:hypothetical protein